MNIIKTFLASLFVAAGLTSCVTTSSVATTHPQNFQNYNDVNYQVFYDELSPYGRWIMDDQYGYVWAPNEGPEFMPYRSNGHWVYTDIGWTWASDYKWGWAAFHYGRWKLDNYYGWVWIPGNEWAPAWVAWSSSPDYYGWAPLEPEWNVNVSINIGRIPSNYWVFVPPQYITNVGWNRYSVPTYRNVTIVRNVTIINNTNVYHNTRFVCGPRPDELGRHTGYAIRPMVIRESSRPIPVSVQEGALCIYRPNVDAKPGNARPNTTINRPRPGSESGNSRPYYPGNQNGDPRQRPEYANGNQNREVRQRWEYPQDRNMNPNEQHGNDRTETDNKQKPQHNPNSNNDAPNVDRTRPSERPDYNREPRPNYTTKDSPLNERPKNERQSEPRIEKVSTERSAPTYERWERMRPTNNGSSNESHGRPRNRS
ncbi:DUF6600 domain-containing protein [Solitalea koreensis]|uniref:YXWGXW repeat-containing protein n=1 Tax=Solitalea koreensis TaxID=543615 RepID=A0A521CYF0_9SPHI|nr:DUF6600 domain-containing protein [Solitalea koreensis]SMO64477.1 hypothetical protein SAMN06265350_10547 [Solitalea koreensis]